jgi:hypothetical protein|tara:strand:+ start:73 stop:1302 length:1230 start_codon:yes stop_codon:yes gene_type:complete
MIKSFVITPYFLETAKENQVLTNDLFEFSLIHKDDSFKEVLFLVIDNNSNFIEKYKNIATKVGAKNLKLKGFIEDFVLKLKREQADINNKNLNIDFFLNQVSDLKNIPKINSQPYISFPIKEERLKKELKHLTQFAKKITIFDPYISQHMTNYSKTGIKQINHQLKNINIKNIEKFEIRIQDSQSYKYSLRQILNFILSDKIEDDLNIKILTTIKNDDKNSFTKINEKIKEKIKETIFKIKKSKIRSEENYLIEEKKKLEELLSVIKSEFYDKENNPIIVQRIKSIISKCFLDIGGNKTKIEFDIINEWLREKPEDRKFYKKGFLIEGDQIKVVVDFGQGLNIYSNSIKTKTINVNGKFTKKNINKFQLQTNPEYQIRVITNKGEKHKYSSIERFTPYVQNADKISINS